MVFTHDFSGPAVEAGGPVLWLSKCFEAVENTECGRTIIDELPATVNVFTDFTFAVPGTGAWTVEKPFGAPGERTNAGEFAEAAGPAAGAFLNPDSL